MVYADTDFFLALRKKSDWLKKGARALLEKHRGQLWTSSFTFVELLLLSREFQLDPVRLIADVSEIADLRGGERINFLRAASYMTEYNVSVFDALHAAACGTQDEIISSDKVFDRLGLRRIPLRP